MVGHSKYQIRPRTKTLQLSGVHLLDDVHARGRGHPFSGVHPAVHEELRFVTLRFALDLKRGEISVNIKRLGECTFLSLGVMRLKSREEKMTSRRACFDRFVSRADVLIHIKETLSNTLPQQSDSSFSLLMTEPVGEAWFGVFLWEPESDLACVRGDLGRARLLRYSEFQHGEQVENIARNIFVLLA